MKESPTPHKSYARSSEKRYRRLKDSPNSNKITSKCLNGALTSISEASVDSSPISEISYANHSEDDNISLLEEALSETLLPSDMMSSKKIIECLDSTMFTSMESEIVATNLRNAKPKVFNSHNAAPQYYKKLLDEISKYVIEDLYTNTVAEDLDCSYQVVSAKNQMVFPCFCFWLIGVLAIFFFFSDIHCPHGGSMST